MRLPLVLTALSVISLAACSSDPKATAPVRANQATTSDSTADASQPARPRRKYCNTGSRLCTESPDVDPTVGTGPAGGLSNTTTNANGGGPH